MRWAEYEGRMEEMRAMYRVSGGKLEGKRPLGRPRRRWEDNIQEVGCGDWTGSSWLRIGDRWRAIVNAVMNLRVP
jgi:hypothetical protein